MEPTAATNRDSVKPARRSPAKWLAGGAAAVLLLCCGAAMVFLFTSCSFNKYLLGAGLPKPDKAFQTGTAVGYDVYIWECYQGRRIVLYHSSAEMFSGPYTREETACGQVTPIEEKLADVKPKRELEPGRFW